MPVAGMLLVFGIYLPRFYAGLGVGFVAIGFATLIVRLVDMLFDPAIALVMDRTKTPVGRYRPWLFLGLPFVLVGIYQLLNPPQQPTVTHMIVWLLVAYVGNSMITLGLAAWSAILATNYHDRSRVYGITQALAVIGSIALLTLPLYTQNKIIPGKAASMPTIGLILIAVFPIAMLITALLTPERIVTPAQRPRFTLSDYAKAISRPSMLRIILADLVLTLGPGTTAPLYVFFFHDAKGFSVKDVGLLLISYIGAGFLGSPFWARVAARLGKHRTIQLACVCYAITQTILMALPRVYGHYSFGDALPTVIGMFSVGFCASAFVLLIRAMVADVVDEVKLDHGQDQTSLLYSMVTTTTKIGTTITALIVLPILGAAGYQAKEGVVNTPHAIFVLEMCYLFAPIILVFGGGAALIGYHLDAKRHSEIREALAAREAASAHLAASEESLIGPTAGAPAE